MNLSPIYLFSKQRRKKNVKNQQQNETDLNCPIWIRPPSMKLFQIFIQYSLFFQNN